MQNTISHRTRIVNWLMPFILVAAVVLLSAVVARVVAVATVQAALTQAEGLPAGAANNAAPTEGTIDPSQVTIRPANRLGASSAPVTIVEYSDFQCPFCGKTEREVVSQLRATYVLSQSLAIVYKHAAFLGDESTWAAQAAECAADQDQFWIYHDLLFARQNGENQGTFTKANLLELARESKLDMSRFEPCLMNDETLARVQADVSEAESLGVRGTPTFFINGQPLVGAQPLSMFEELIVALRTER